MTLGRLALFATLFVTTPSHADERCVNVSVQFTPSASLQIVAWVENTSGTYIDTIYMTAKTGVYGLGNRPGRWDFNSGPVTWTENWKNGVWTPSSTPTHTDDMWPYGRRTTTFPIWASRHPYEFGAVVFQDGDDNNLSHSFDQSSIEKAPPYCRPVSREGLDSCWNSTDKTIWDTGTCATNTYTDKGKYSTMMKSKYPPRSDVTRKSQDHADVLRYAADNPFDSVSRATPKGGMPTEIRWAVPRDLPSGDYVLWVEASKAFDFNSTYNPTKYPAPNVAWGSCGEPYRGQPSVVYRVPFTIGVTETTSETDAYHGYGSPDGSDGNVRPPDSTITTDTPGSGALRFQLVSDDSLYRVRVKATPELDFANPGVPQSLAVSKVESFGATLEFIEPGDDGLIGTVTGYTVRVRANSEMTVENFADSTIVVAEVTPAGPGQIAKIELTGLLPETDYWVGIRAYDDCYNESEVAIVALTTADRQAGEVDACFVATAAYGSLLANDVELLRHTRDVFLRRTVVGELAVAGYYTFGPALAGVVGESELLRASARSFLEPIIAWVRGLAY
jgi:hypothetical protein